MVKKIIMNLGLHRSSSLIGKWKWKLLSCVQLFETLWTVACQAPLPMEFSRQKYWSGLPCPPPGIFQPRDWIQVSCTVGRFLTTEPLGKPPGTDLGLKKILIHYNTTEYLGFLVLSQICGLDTLKRLVLCPFINLSVIGWSCCFSHVLADFLSLFSHTF